MADCNKEKIIAAIVTRLETVTDDAGDPLVTLWGRGAPVAVPDEDLPIGFVQGMDDTSQKQGAGWEQCLWRIGICFQVKKPITAVKPKEPTTAEKVTDLTALDKLMLAAENKIRVALNGFQPEGGLIMNWFRTFTPFEHMGVPSGYIMPAFNVLRNESIG